MLKEKVAWIPVSDKLTLNKGVLKNLLSAQAGFICFL